MELKFTTDAPVEAQDYLVLGRLLAANGYDGTQFIVCTYVSGEWYFAPDGPTCDTGLFMWDGGSSSEGNGTVPCPFTPVAWALLPEPVEAPDWSNLAELTKGVAP